VAVVTDVYRARDTDEDARTVRSDSLVRSINELRPQSPALLAPTFCDIQSTLRTLGREGDAVIFMGAGDISELAKAYAGELDQCSLGDRAQES